MAADWVELCFLLHLCCAVCNTYNDIHMRKIKDYSLPPLPSLLLLLAQLFSRQMSHSYVVDLDVLELII